MSWMLELARPEIRALKAYEHARWEPGLVRLNANELPWRSPAEHSEAGLNRYPEPHPHALAATLARHYGVPASMLLPARGSDEAIDVLIRAFCRAGQDAVLICPPTFGMYAVAARIQGARVLEVPLQRAAGFALDVAAVRAACLASQAPVKLVFLCSPNNPTGNLLAPAAVLELVQALEGRALVIVDEAYIEFSEAPSLTALVSERPGLAVLRTLSKAHALAGARCGSLIAQAELISLLRKVIMPYALAQPTIEAVLRALQPEVQRQMQQHLLALRAERSRMAAALSALPGVQRVWPSEANFLLIECADAARLIARAHAGGLLLRDLSAAPQLAQAVRVTLGTPEQNERLLASLA
jgi:histidinol-phosphate aminotransferase